METTKSKLVIFDLDGTLAPAKSSMDAEMGELLGKLLKKYKVAVISGGAFPQFEIQFLKNFPMDNINFSNLYLLPTSGTRMYTWKGSWHEDYSETLTAKEKEKIMHALQAALKMSGYKEEKLFGAAIEDRDSQITFSGLGQSAPLDLKEKWDPDHSKRHKIVTILEKRIPEFEVRLGGTTSIDITRRGVNKAYGIRKLEKLLTLDPHQILFVGDALFYGGNDFPAKATGVDTKEVKDPNETKKVISELVS